jgi:predicted alpha/beta superfamily hydrolase
MKISWLIIVICFLGNSVIAQFTTKMTITHSANIGDSFEIYTSLPRSFDAAKHYNVVYYCDANLKSGRAIRNLLSTNQYDKKLANTIFVGVGHIGNYHVLRRRDFILPTINGKDTAGKDANYGQVAKFYVFLKDELIPSVNTKFNTNQANNSILGHSLGGLFAFYCLFKSDNLFAKYFALSPALWIDKYSIYKFNKIQGGLPNKKYLYFVTGGKEVMNHIRKGTNRAKEFLDEKKYSNLTYEYTIVKWKTHNSQVPITLKKIFDEKLNN